MVSKESFDVEKIVLDLVLTDDPSKKKLISRKIIDFAQDLGTYPASINELYFARGRGEFGGFTVPAINLRSLTYDLACAVFRVAKRYNCGAFIFEIAKSEIGYTDQPPVEFAGKIMAAAIKEDYVGPVFIQGDHFQVKASKFQENADKEIGVLKSLIKDSIDSGFYNIDVDSSTLVDISKVGLKDQQFFNFDVCAELTKFIRSNQPKGINVSVGGEIGEIGSRNSTPEDLRAFMTGLNEKLNNKMLGISKISVQTGTTHGGVVLPDGSISKVKLDFETLKLLSNICHDEYGLAGAVQHGASTLPEEAFHKFVECNTAEVHLATQFQNIIYESTHFPVNLKRRIYSWLKENLISESKKGWTEEQFYYKLRKKGFGPFKKEIASLPKETRDLIATEVEFKFDFLFNQLNIKKTKDLVKKYCSNINQTR
jgi:fructose/tagatose bisphosphate aldolase